MSFEQFHSTFLTLETSGPTLVARITRPRLSEEDNLEEMGQDLQSLIDHHQCRQLVLNLETVQFITSAALGKLITLHRRIHRKAGRLILCHAQGSVADVLQTTQLINYFTVAPDAQQALAMYV